MRSPIVLTAACLVLAGCNDSSTGPTGEGSIQVAVFTSGGDPDLDGYELRLDDRVGVALSPIDEQTYLVAAGRHELELTEVAPNCTVSGGPSHTVTLATGGNERVEFRVVCRATGFQVSATTFGIDRDLSGYQITVDGVTKGTVSANGQVLISRLAPGDYTVGVGGVSQNCTLEGPPTRTLSVTNAELSPVAFAFTCVATFGVVKIEVATTGPRPDNLLIAESSPFPGFDQPVAAISVTGSGFAYLAPVAGVRYVRLTDVAPHCTVEGENSREVSVTVGGTIRDTVVAHFDMTCTAGDATLRVSMGSTGSEVPEAFTLRVDRVFGCNYYYGCNTEFFDEFQIAPDGLTSISLPSDHYQVSLVYVSTCRWEGYSASIDFPTGGTEDIAFEIYCERPLLRVTAPTTGSNPDTHYTVTLWSNDWYYGTYSTLLGPLAPGETMEARVGPSYYGYSVELGQVAANCTVGTTNPTAAFTIDWGQTRDVTFPVTCGP